MIRSVEFFRECVFKRDGRERKVLYILMNARDYAHVRKFGRGVLEIETRMDLLRWGLMAHLWGAELRCERGFPLRRMRVEYDTGIETWCEDHGWTPGEGCPDPVHAVEEVHEG